MSYVHDCILIEFLDLKYSISVIVYTIIKISVHAVINKMPQCVEVFVRYVVQNLE